ncbi:MAG: hypothetical protein NXI22_17400 [bacterium]|nr:hypothetical protein [bacterium]
MYYVNIASNKFLYLVNGLTSDQWLWIMAGACALGFVLLRGFGANQRL